jgi:Concanavalin A-like lectin/glucanases superfamily
MNTKLQNLFVAAAAVLLMATAGQAQSTYFQAVTNLNPVGYWPMHEVEAAAPGDIETNYGSAGPLANGYYGDWVTPGSPNPDPILHGWQSGALAGDSDPCVNFNFNYGTGSGAKGSATNCLIVPHTSPAAALVPPFTVECWYLFTNSFGSGKQSDIWSSVGNANGSGNGLNGISTYSGIRLFFNNYLVVYTYDGTNSYNTGNSSVNIPFNNGKWWHLVLTDDGTNITVYQNGVATLSNISNSTYVPNYWDPLEIDTGKGFTRDASGLLDEFAIYTNALSADDIMAHYAAGTNASPATPYKTLVLNDHPTIYFRMDSPTYTKPSVGALPGLTNYGSAAVNGVYMPGVAPAAVAGPNNGSVFAAGFGANTNAMPGNGMSSYADAGYASAYNPTGTNAFSVAAWFQGGPCDSRTQTIVGHSADSWSVNMTTAGQLQCQLGTNSSSAVTSAGIYNDGYWHEVVAVYTPNSNPALPGTNALYVDGVLDAMTNNVTTNGILPGTNSDVMIGSDPQYTNSPVALGRQFAGNVCEVALFTNALTASQIQSLYNAGEMPPFISQQPVSATVNQGNAFTDPAVAHGYSPLAYQWYASPSGVPVSGQTNASLALNPALADDATNYYVIVTNSYGSATSAVVAIAVVATPAIVGQFPVTYTNVFTLYAGANPTFSVSAIGALPIYYNWFTNGVLDGVATNASLPLTNVQVGVVITNYYCVVSNSLASVTSVVWSASVIADPTNTGGGLAPYPQSVLALNPIAYWRLNEPDDSVYDGNPRAVALDYAGGNDGLYNNVVLGNAGYNPVADPSDTSVMVGGLPGATTNSYASQVGTNVDFSAPAGSNAEFSVETWVSLFSLSGSPQGVGLVCKGTANGGEEFALDTTASGAFRFFVRSASGTQYSATSTLVPQLNTFYHLVGVCDEAHSNLLLYVNGALVAQASIPPLSGIYSDSAVSLTIGARSPNPAAISQQALGYFNDVALFNYALSSSQITNQYLGSGIPPSITQQPPANVNVNQNGTVLVSATAAGTPPLFYQWYDANQFTSLPNQTNSTLVVSNVTSGEAYYLVVTNLYGTTNTITVTVNIVSGLTVTNPTPANLTLYAGQSFTYNVQALGTLPIYYQWNQGASPIPDATNASYTAVAALGSTTYTCTVSNAYNGYSVASAGPVTLTGIAAPTNAYSVAVLSNHPIAYWRLDETSGNIAYDYVGGHDGTYSNAQQGVSGYPAPNLAALFGTVLPTNSYVGEMDNSSNAIANIDFSQPSGGNAEFSVEAWVNGASSQISGAGIVAKGYGNGGEQFDLDAYTNTSLNTVCFRFFVRDASGSTHGATSTFALNGNWHHVVGVCDEAGGAVHLYVDGVDRADGSIVVGSGLLKTSDGSVPGASRVSIGSRTSASAVAFDNQFDGTLDEVALYNSALSASQVAGHYQAAVSSGVNTNPTNLVFSVSGNQLTLSWPTDHTGWRLRAQTNNPGAGISTNWFDVANANSTNQVVLPINAANGSVFYRMVYP